jgi:hypothetical protein
LGGGRVAESECHVEVIGSYLMYDILKRRKKKKAQVFN